MTAISAELGSDIEYADALDWLAAREPGAATAVIFDPALCGRLARPWPGGRRGRVGVRSAVIYAADHVAVRPGTAAQRHRDHLRRLQAPSGSDVRGDHVGPAALRMRRMGEARPGTGGLFRSSWAPVLIASRGTPVAVDRATVRNVVETDNDVVYAN